MSHIAVMDLAGFAAFALAAVLSYRNYLETRDIDRTWLTMTSALLVGSLWSLVVALEWMGILPSLTGMLEDVLFVFLTGILVFNSFQVHRGVVKPVR